MNDLIEKLKDKNYVRAFGLLDPEERKCMEKVKKAHCLCFHGGQWGGPNNSNDCFNYQYTYAIKPDYQPEPEFVDLKIKIINNGRNLGISTQDKLNINYGVVYLYEVPSLPNFVAFRLESVPNIRISRVASAISEGKTVFARFRA